MFPVLMRSSTAFSYRGEGLISSRRRFPASAGATPSSPPGRSRRSTGMPKPAAKAAICAPIVPAPRTATRSIPNAPAADSPVELMWPPLAAPTR